MIVLAALLLIVTGCGGVDVTPNRHQVETITYVFRDGADQPSDAALDAATYRTALDFVHQLGGHPLRHICCRQNQIYVTDARPVIPATGQEVPEYTYPQDHSVVHDQELMGSQRGISYIVGKHLVSSMFPPGTPSDEKAKYADYDPQTGRWEVTLPPDQVYTHRIIP